MDRIFFEEKQTLPGVLRWIAIFASLAICFPFLRGIYIRTILNEPWGKDSLSNGEMYGIVLVLFAVGALMTWLVSSMYMEMKIDNGAIQYRFFLHHSKYQRLDKAAIADYAIRKLTWQEMVQGRRSSKFRRKKEDQIFKLNGNVALVINLHDGQKLILGTQNPEGLLWAMKKLMSNS